jgi:hypothetical protein
MNGLMSYKRARGCDFSLAHLLPSWDRVAKRPMPDVGPSNLGLLKFVTNSFCSS